MFTGIVEAVGRVRRVLPAGGSVRLEIESALPVEEIRIGDSVAVGGACLTVVERGTGWLAFEVVPETLSRTSLGGLGPGDAVNLERALAAGARFDGHLVQGHVDAVGEVVEVVAAGGETRLAVESGRDFADLLVEKGSVAVDGVSLTVARVGADRFEVALIPHTLAHTTLGLRAVGDPVNLEADVLGKYVKKYVEGLLGARVSRGAGREDR